MKHRTIILPIGGSGGSGPQPSGTITINREGIFDVTSYASAKVEIPNPIEQPNYLCFIANGSGSVGFHVDESASRIPHLEYSFDKENWNVWDFSDISLENSEEVYFRGINHSGLSYSNIIRDNNYFTTSDNASFDVLGDISTLIDYANDTIIPSNYAFSRLFYGTKVISADDLILPYDTVGPYWYQYMFANCVMLDSVPALPATTIDQYGYRSMFSDCLELRNAPELPATTLASYCYYSMFYNCSQLVTAPELPATTLASYCYYRMFSGCTALTAAPALPATTLAQSCYQGMFQGCTSLVTAPALPATTLAQNCYSSMFTGCIWLESAPALPATTLDQSCYMNMFQGCTSLVTAPALPATALAQNCYSGMFTGCSSLESAPALPATTLAQNCYSSMFTGCSSLESAPALPATTLAQGCYNSMFYGCSSLTAAPELPATTLAPNCYYGMFRGCSSLVNAPSELPATTLDQSCYSSMFTGCSSLESAPALPATTLDQSCYSSMFTGCSSLESAPALPATTLAQGCYSGMFQGCTSLVTAPALPATTLAQNCYSGMFYGCSSLTAAPELPATTLAQNCYYGMFYGCISLVTAPEIKATSFATPRGTAAACMFQNCSSLNEITVYTTSWINQTNWVSGVAATGDFKNLGGATIPTGTNGIPTGWTEIKPDYLYFEDISGSNNTLTLTRTNTGGLAPTVTLEYSTDGENWQEWQAVNDVRTYEIPANGKVYLRGNNTAFGQGTNNTDVHTFSSTGNIEAHGNIMTLLDKTGQSTSFATSGTFKFLFRNMTTLKTAPDMPATTLSNACYFCMYYGSGITEAPDLPATTIYTSSYVSMFENTPLTKAAKMTVTGYSSGSTNQFRSMYSGCSNLTDISGITINVTNIPQACFVNAFYNCTSLTKAAPMTVNTIQRDSFNATYEGCSSLSDISGFIFNATEFFESSCRRMFCNCTSLTKALPMTIATLSGIGSFNSCYDGCSSLSDISGVHITATTATNGSFKIMFRGTAITESPDLSSLTTLYGIGDQSNGSLSYMFQNCSNLKKITVGFSTWDYSYTFQWVTNVPSGGIFYNLGGSTISSDNNGIPTGWTELKSKALSFTNKSSSSNTLTLTRYNQEGQCPTVVLEYSTDGVNWQEWQAVNDVRTYSIPGNGTVYLRGNNTAFGQNANGYDYHQFASTRNIEAHGNIMSLLDKTMQSTTITSTGCFRSLFRNMTKLKIAPELPATTLNNAAYIYMFQKTGITEAPDLPATRIGNEYYYGMFYQCPSLTKAAKMTINEFISGHVNACREMYSGCSNLTDISGITINATSFTESAFQYAFNNCTSLTKAIPMTIASVRGNTFAWMYNGCSSLTDISGVRITATTATWGSFKVMFKGTAITESPDLSSLTSFYANSSDLGKGSLAQMFQNCSNLSKITVGCSTWDTDFADQWVSGVAATGDFYNLGQATIPTGTNGIPTGWTEHTSL